MMTENDYIAEYVKAKHPGLLGFDFALWKGTKKLIEIGRNLTNILSSMSEEDIKKYIEDQENEEE